MRKFVPLVLLGLAPLSVSAGVLDAQVTEHSLESTDGLELINVNGAEEPTLIVNDLKHGNVSG
jgi:hypothetical protein